MRRCGTSRSPCIRDRSPDMTSLQNSRLMHAASNAAPTFNVAHQLCLGDVLAFVPEAGHVERLIDPNLCVVGALRANTCCSNINYETFMSIYYCCHAPTMRIVPLLHLAFQLPSTVIHCSPFMRKPSCFHETAHKCWVIFYSLLPVC